ncbi:hypothetical protein [Methylomonas sp. AM2-LC]|uniref:hypothetical protein n=1 Tax=Methylomonas sp. AM2-LC TaxID=3153301 RepID=UPI003262D761
MHIQFNIRLLTATTFLMFSACLCAEQATPTHIGLEISADNLPSIPSELTNKIRSNLSEWGYSLPSSGPYSHQLRAVIGKINHENTPVGFSFSSGNSDPRASDFQKADVLPITCRLTDEAHAKIVSEWQSSFSVSTDTPKNSEKLNDEISTVCLEVLNRAKISKQQTPENTTLKQPKWLPSVSIVVKNANTDRQNTGGVSKEETSTDDEKKELIIQNQGTPLTIQFGPDRR